MPSQNMTPLKIQTVLFDLDGTFADTAPDLAHALNQTLRAHNLASMELAQIRPVVSHGGKALIQLGFGISENHPDFESLRKELLDFYIQDIALHTQLFSGIETLLEDLNQQNMNWGIVTNKPGWLTGPLMDSLGLSYKACSIVSGDTLEKRKPDPAPLLHAARQCGARPESCLYIGDAERDIVAGKHAGMRTMVANYGYIEATEEPASWHADCYIDHPNEIFNWIMTVNNNAIVESR
jgi:phosphoglycolate phosphatase